LVSQEKIDEVLRIYQEAYRQFFDKPDKYKVKITTSQISLVRNFLKQNESLGDLNVEFYTRFIEFQFNRNMSLAYSRNNQVWKTILISHVFGNKAQEAWKKSSVFQRLKRSMTFKVVRNVEKKERVHSGNFDFEISIKKGYENDDLRLYKCISTTSLYDPRHEVCLSCLCSKKCAEVLKKNLPKLHKLRGL
jgi:hypothetical protein